MNSSTSSSEAADAVAWSGWLRLIAAIVAGGTLLLFAAVVLADPFSTGRFAASDDFTVVTRLRAFANAGRVRDPAFDSAIIGNSIALRYDPVLLSELTGNKVVQLSIAGIGAAEQLKLAHTFIARHGGAPHLLVWSIDHVWCGPAQTAMPFPDWLYQDGKGSNGVYLRHIFSPEALIASFAKIAIVMFGKRPEGARDGRREGNGAMPAHVQRLARELMATVSQPRDAGAFSVRREQFDTLESYVAGLPATTTVVLVFPPRHRSLLPEPGSPAEASLNACKARAAAVAGKLPRGAVVDWLTDTPSTRDADNFWDSMHMKDHVADAVVADIGATVRKLVQR